MHDAAFKLIYSQPHMVEDLLRGFLPDGAWSGTLTTAPRGRVKPEDGDYHLAMRVCLDSELAYTLTSSVESGGWQD